MFNQACSKRQQLVARYGDVCVKRTLTHTTPQIHRLSTDYPWSIVTIKGHNNAMNFLQRLNDDKSLEWP